MHRDRQRYSAEWQKMMPNSVTTSNYHHHNTSQFDNDGHQSYQSLQNHLEKKVLLSPFSSKQEDSPLQNVKAPMNNCCSSSSISCKSPLIHPSHYCPVQVISALISSLSKDIGRTRSCKRAPPTAASATLPLPSSVVRPQKSRRARNKSASSSLESPSSEWLNLISSWPRKAQVSRETANPRSYAALTAEASLNADFLDCDYTMADPASVIAGAYLPIGSISTVTVMPGGAVECKADVTVNAFESTYSLHRCILERVPYFAAMLSGQWNETGNHVLSIFPDEMDPNITRVGFEVALEYMYGRKVMDLIELDPIGVFAACQWLDLSEPLKWAVQNIMHHLDISNIHLILSIFTEYHYGKEGRVVLDAAKSLLRLRGCEMPLAVWDHIPAEIVRDIVGGDAFYMPSELKRWEYAVSLLDRVLESKASKMRIPFLNDNASAPAHVKRQLEGILPDDPPEADTDTELDFETDRQFSEDMHNQWLNLYTHPDILPIRQMIMEDIAYMHIPLEHFRRVQSHRDIFGVRPVQPAVIHSAFVQALKLAHLVDTADEFSLKLDIGHATFMSEFPARQRSQIHRFHIDSGFYPCSMPGGDVIRREYPVTKEDTTTSNLTVTRKARGFIHQDCNKHAGQQGFRTSHLVMGWERRDFIKPLPINSTVTHPDHSPFPPFRFSTTFPHPATLENRQRLFSSPFWYAGATWVLYLCHNTIPKASSVGLYLRRIYDTRPAEPSLESWSSRINPPGMAHYEPLVACHSRPSNPHLDEPSNYYNEAYPRLDLVGDRFGSRNGVGHSLGRERDTPALLPYVDIRSSVTAHFKLYSNFVCAGQPACFQSKPEQFQIDRCWGWDVRVPDGQEPLLDLCGNPLNERQLKICLVIGIL
ncbi:uncharacterized protein BDCG_07761 [Blastomyces dermatitidis ER-3]|uniref:BTB domain-containing protein n=1 Tax=Ajellomyces dermatitidis (strain ER-3 / ATCC MYA-2586) TaxID=559297 RepID=A0ABP2F6A5_AJEDR|nr:uncharacterized protein BDCG_07761 [Blastomyces dermatitidis ER-3]EEQ92641.2 hypothetical protein BDCG_07761 [Blastomyces dermatitidis ER-3]